jgi:hypothetical protein
VFVPIETSVSGSAWAAEEATKISASRAGKRSSLFIDVFPDPSTNLPDAEKSISSV